MTNNDKVTIIRSSSSSSSSSASASKCILIWALTVLFCFGGFAKSHEQTNINTTIITTNSNNNNCTNVKCPIKPTTTDEDIQCPADSYSREIRLDLTPGLVDEQQVNCCIRKECFCRDCHIPTCNNPSLVLIEIESATNIPGNCCSKYDCVIEPNCAEIINTSGYWLIDCQRCHCLSGQKICHRSCDEVRKLPANCLSQNFTVFKHGQTWKEDPCTQCECKNGETKCQTSFCRPLNCPNKIKLESECCPMCILGPTDHDTSSATTRTTTTTSTTTTSTTNLDDFDNNDNIDFDKIHYTTNQSTKYPCNDSSSSSSSSSSSTSTTTPITLIPTPTTENSNTYSSVHTEIIEVIVPTKQNCILYGVIVALTIMLIIFVALYLHERSKQRSYRPVSALDDNFNKITGKIKSNEINYA